MEKSEFEQAYVYTEGENGMILVKFLDRKAEVAVIPERVEGKPVVAIEDGCFFLCENLREVRIPEGVTAIGSQAFAMCRSLQSLELPESLRFLGHHLIRDSGIREITVPAGVETLERAVFSYASSLRTVHLQEGLKTIRTHAFYMTRVGEESPLHLPDSVETIENGGFYKHIGGMDLDTDRPLEEAWFLDME